MSFIHNLTIGHLDPNAVTRCRKATATAPLGEELLELFRAYVDDETSNRLTLGGHSVKVNAYTIECRWWTLAEHNEKAVEFAKKALELGYVVADVPNFKIITIEGL